MARRYADQLQNHPEPYCKTESNRDHGAGWHLRSSSEKEVIELKKELAKLQKNLGGIKEMKRLPDAIFVVDPKKRESAYRKLIHWEFR